MSSRMHACQHLLVWISSKIPTVLENEYVCRTHPLDIVLQFVSTDQALCLYPQGWRQVQYMSGKFPWWVRPLTMRAMRVRIHNRIYLQVSPVPPPLTLWTDIACCKSATLLVTCVCIERLRLQHA